MSTYIITNMWIFVFKGLDQNNVTQEQKKFDLNETLCKNCNPGNAFSIQG